METRKIILPCQLISYDESSTFKIKPSNFEKVDIAFHICLDSEKSVFYDNNVEGCLMLQEFWLEELNKIYFGINSKGELIAVFPPGYDGEINENGELIIAKEDS